jgi:hypothetical protein
MHDFPPDFCGSDYPVYSSQVARQPGREILIPVSGASPLWIAFPGEAEQQVMRMFWWLISAEWLK